jgi:hypothetical protein
VTPHALSLTPYGVDETPAPTTTAKFIVPPSF